MRRYTYVHSGLTCFLSDLVEKHGFGIVYVTSRPLYHIKQTRDLIANVKQLRNGSSSGRSSSSSRKNAADDRLSGKMDAMEADMVHLPPGPIFCNRESPTSAGYRELVARDSVSFKTSALWGITDAYRRSQSSQHMNSDTSTVMNSIEKAADKAAMKGRGHDTLGSLSASMGIPPVPPKESLHQQSSSSSSSPLAAAPALICPYVLGIGNREADAAAYYNAGVPESNIFLIDTSSAISAWTASGGSRGTRVLHENNQIFDSYSDPGLLPHMEKLVEKLLLSPPPLSVRNKPSDDTKVLLAGTTTLATLVKQDLL
jgi:phosphatidate phosphatase PAH1